eukprot:gene10925-biopygen11005
MSPSNEYYIHEDFLEVILSRVISPSNFHFKEVVLVCKRWNCIASRCATKLVTKLVIPRSSLESVVRLRNIEWLQLDTTSVDWSIKLAPLSGLKSLKYLDISDGMFANIVPLSGLTALTELNVSGNPIVDLVPLSGLTNLKKLDINDCMIGCNQSYNLHWFNALSPLSGLTALTELNLSNNRILKNIAPLSGLTALTKLDMSLYFLEVILSRVISPSNFHFKEVVLVCKRWNCIASRCATKLVAKLVIPRSSLESVSRLRNLEWLQLDPSVDWTINLAPLSGLNSLKYLDIHGLLVDIVPLSGLTALTELKLSYNRLVDLAPLSGLTDLKKLDIERQWVDDIVPLSGLTALTELNMSRNYLLRNIAPLSGLTALTKLDMSLTSVRNIAPLSGLTTLRNLYITDFVFDETPLSGLTYLQIHIVPV